MEKSIGNYMIKSPYVGDSELGLQEALDLLLECGIRHLPIVESEKLIGVVSDRDLRAAVSLPQASQLCVGDIMKREVFIAKRSTPLREIVRTMQERKLGSTVIVNDAQEVLGIFTVTDALGILADLLEDAGEEGNRFVDDFEDAFEAWHPGAIA